MLSAHTRLLATQTLMVLMTAVLATAATLALFGGGLRSVILIVGAVALLLSLALSGNPRLFLLWGLVLTLPLNLNKSFFIVPHMGGAGAFTIDVADLFLIPLAIFLIRDLAYGYRVGIRIPRFSLYWGVLMALGLLTVVMGPMRHVALLEVVRMAKLLLLFLVLVNEVVRVRQFGHVIAALTVGVALQCGYGLLQFVFGQSFGLEFLGETPQDEVEYTSRATYSGGEFTHRIGALMGHPNLLAVYLAMILPICIGMMFVKVNAWVRLLMGTVIAMGVCVLVLTLSRAAWLGFAVAMMVFMAAAFLQPSLRARHLVGKIGMVVFGCVMTLALSGPILKRLFESDPGAISFRWEIMEWSWNMILAKPILGFGLNSYVWHMPPYSSLASTQAVMDRFGDLLPVVHNIYFLVWAEQGTVGLLVFLALHVHLIRLAIINMRYRTNETLAMINIGALGGLCALIIDGIASFFIRNDAPGRIFITVVALIVAVNYWYRANDINRFNQRPSHAITNDAT